MAVRSIGKPLVIIACATLLMSGMCTSPNPAPAPTTAQAIPVSTEKTTLTIDITDIKGQSGSLRVSVFAAPEGFLSDDSKALAKTAIPAAGPAHRLTFSLPPGRYAVAVLHDGNDNARLDTNFLGIPSEGYGVTNNPKPRFRAPRFQEATFELAPSGTTLTVSLQYVG
jgi:uncharacterized protein (DUF2141 family)